MHAAVDDAAEAVVDVEATVGASVALETLVAVDGVVDDVVVAVCVFIVIQSSLSLFKEILQQQIRGNKPSFRSKALVEKTRFLILSRQGGGVG